MKTKKGYDWTFSSVGGAARVKITSGRDIARLGELDRKLWTVLSCPVAGLEFDQKTLEIMDTDGDGKIRVDEVIATAQWLTGILKDPDLLLKEDSELPFSAFNTENENGARLLASARQILANLKLEKDSIALEDTSDSVRIFAETRFNGDGIITPASAGEDEKLAELIATIGAAVGKAMDRSGVDGITADHVEAFYTAAADFKAWKETGEADKTAILPYGDGTAAALDACNALKDKIADYFMRCKLIAFDDAVSDAVDVSAEKIGAISGENLSLHADEIATYPLARPDANRILPLKGGINPAWQTAFDTLKTLVFDVDFPDADGITEAQWNEITAKFGPYSAWMGAKKGAEVEGLGLEAVEAILKENRKDDLLALVEQDKALEEEAVSIETVDKFLRLYKNFYKFLNNYVVFSDFYSDAKGLKAIFQAGRLYIDQRSTDLCIRVQDMSRHADMAALSGMFILYCTCTSKKLGKSMDIAAVLTDGDVNELRIGRNAVFYDREGVDWDAMVTRIVENPISIRQAFWAPYRKVGRWISDKIDKSASEKNDKSLANLTATADSATNSPSEAGTAAKSTFDIAKFAGIFAAIGMAVAFLSTALVSIAKGVASLSLWKLLLVIAVLMLVISAPSMFIAWRKLRKRDLGPLLNANGWAINAASYVNIKFGATLTSLAKFPRLKAVDPAARRKARIRSFLWTLLVVVVLAVGGLYFFTDKLDGVLRRNKAVVEQVEEQPVPVETEEVTDGSDEVPATAEDTTEDAS